MPSYYSNHLAGERLRACYVLAPPRVHQYLETEILHVLSRIRPEDAVLELGCGYGRVLERIAATARVAVGIDSAHVSLQLASEMLHDRVTFRLLGMDAVALAFRDGVFDVVVCIQNGISAFKVDQRRLFAESVRVTRPGGTVLFSSYSAKFWPHRLEWFELQAQHGLLGEIDRDATGNGVIVCRDGFRATTVDPDEFRTLATGLGVDCRIFEVDASSIFCEITA
jgi:SAM-dependent methyltransferase